jgi:hypothetical protein
MVHGCGITRIRSPSDASSFPDGGMAVSANVKLAARDITMN